MAEHLIAERLIYSINVCGQELTVSEWAGQEFLTIDLPHNVTIWPEGFWENLITEIQEELKVKVTGTSGSFMEERGRFGARSFILVFYQPQINAKDNPSKIDLKKHPFVH